MTLTLNAAKLADAAVFADAAQSISPDPPSPNADCAEFPDRTCLIVHRPADGVMTPEWQANCFGYAYANCKDSMSPRCIVYAETIDDVQKVVAYATATDVAIAVRCGSHHYLGACSTTGNNIQLDLSALQAAESLATPWKKLEIDAKTGIVTAGPGVSLGVLSAALKDVNRWVPFGECSSVMLGGHVQSGGYSPGFCSIGGFLVDYMLSYDIVVASGELKTVYRDISKNKTALDSELFWALAGSSPGSYGVVTGMSFRTNADADWDPVVSFGSSVDPRTGCRFVGGGLFTEERLVSILSLWAKVSDQLDLPEDQRILPTGARFQVRVGTTVHSEEVEKDRRSIADLEVKQYEDGKFFSRDKEEAAKLRHDAMGQIPPMPLPTMGVYVDVFARKDMSAEDKAKHAEKTTAFFAVVDEALGFKQVPADQVPPSMALSMSAHAFEENTVFVEKEFLRPYEKFNVYGGFDSNTGERKLYDEATESSKFAETLAKEFTAISNTPSAVGSTCVMLGGPGFELRQDRRTFAPFRSGANKGPIPSWMQFAPWWGRASGDKEKCLAACNRVEKAMVGPEGLFATRRMMTVAMPWGSLHMDAPENRLAYWDTEDNYQRLLAVKKAVDPTWTFTSNPFGIGASDPDAAKHVKGE